MDWRLDVPAGAAPPTTPIIYAPGDIELEPNADKTYGLRPMTYNSFHNNVLAYDMNRPAGTAYYHKPRGSWRINQIYAISGGGNHIVPRITDTDVYVKFEITEPLVLSPCIRNQRRKKWFCGIQSMNFQMVMNGGTQTDRGEAPLTMRLWTNAQWQQ